MKATTTAASTLPIGLAAIKRIMGDIEAGKKRLLELQGENVPESHTKAIEQIQKGMEMGRTMLLQLDVLTRTVKSLPANARVDLDAQELRLLAMATKEMDAPATE